MLARFGLSYRTSTGTEQAWQIFVQACNNLETSKKRANRTVASYVEGSTGVVGGTGNQIPQWQDGRANIWNAVLAVRRPVVNWCQRLAWPGGAAVALAETT